MGRNGLRDGGASGRNGLRDGWAFGLNGRGDFGGAFGLLRHALGRGKVDRNLAQQTCMVFAAWRQVYCVCSMLRTRQARSTWSSWFQRGLVAVEFQSKPRYVTYLRPNLDY